jgi:uncharacterized LabA/DUF88 family protein
VTDTALKIAVFIDFDNIEIGVKTTLNQQFDIAAVLEGIKERGEVVTKVAYGDWKRAGDYGRLLSQHAIRMVQRTVTPGGDKNGADINLALDALEMAFTHDHINAFVIVGGDSDFITLVEKLKQYDKKVFVVGGRQFTSLVMQKNCHEFIAYENLVGGRRTAATGRRGDAAPSGPADVAKAIPLVKRALKVLVDREVSPQLGLLKSTLLQLDSTFSERDYGASTFRDFIEKIARTGLLTVRHSGRSLLVDLTDVGPIPEAPLSGTPVPPPREMAAESSAPAPPGAVHEETTVAAPPAVDAGQAQQAVQHVRETFGRASQSPRWPMYVRQLKQYLRAADEGFDERKWGFATIVELLRACQREGVFRLERDRKGVMRVFPGASLQRPPISGDAASAPQPEEAGDEAAANAVETAEPGAQVEFEPAAQEVAAAGEVTIEFTPEAPEPDASTPEMEQPVRPARARRARKTASSGKPAARRPAGPKVAAPRKRRNPA